jgi:hypothetical protein
LITPARAETALITPAIAPPPPENASGTTFSPQPFPQAEIDFWLENTQNPEFLRKIIKCESQNTNVARMDSNGLISFGLLQFNGTATWSQFAPLADVSGTPMNPIAAIKVADWMISHGEIHRWTCARLTGII